MYVCVFICMFLYVCVHVCVHAVEKLHLVAVPDRRLSICIEVIHSCCKTDL